MIRPIPPYSCIGEAFPLRHGEILFAPVQVVLQGTFGCGRCGASGEEVYAPLDQPPGPDGLPARALCTCTACGGYGAMMPGEILYVDVAGSWDREYTMPVIHGRAILRHPWGEQQFAPRTVPLARA